jgi:spore coat protein U domain-containing protein, fimbrial subunit CupE1/2/3/6
VNLGRTVIGLTALLLSGGEMRAQSCNFSMTNMSWGSIDTGSASNFDMTGTFTANCTGVSLLTVRVCPSFGAGTGGANGSGSERYMAQGAEDMIYNLYSDPARTTVWGSYFWGAGPTPPTIDVQLNALGSGSASRTVYGRIVSGQSNLPTGTYSSSFAGGESSSAYGYSLLGTCSTIGSTNATQVPFTASATRLGSCTVTASDLNFGSHNLLNSNIDASNNIVVNCTPELDYVIGLSGGNHGTTAQRKMANAGNTEFVTYGLYKDAGRSQVWGDNGVLLFSGTGTGANQNLNAYGRVAPQTTPSANSYTDIVVITVTY